MTTSVDASTVRRVVRTVTWLTVVVVPEDPFAEREGGAELAGEPELGLDRRLRSDEPRAGLEVALLVRRQGELGEPGRDLGAGQPFVLDAVGLRSGHGLLEEALGCRASRSWPRAAPARDPPHRVRTCAPVRSSISRQSSWDRRTSGT